MKWCKLYCAFVSLLVLLVSPLGKSIPVAGTPSTIEKVLEKLGARVGDNEYVTVIKKPVESGAIKPKTFVLLSKLYMLRGEENSVSNNELGVKRSGMVKFPLEGLDFRYPPLPVKSEVVMGRILFPEASADAAEFSPLGAMNSIKGMMGRLMPAERITSTTTPTTAVCVDSTTFPSTERSHTSTSKYVENFLGLSAKETESSITTSTMPSRRVYSLPTGMKYSPPTGSKPLATEATSSKPLNNADTTNPILNIDPLEQAMERDKTVAENDSIGFHTLIQVPAREKKESGCNPGELKDHVGKCRTQGHFRPSLPRRTYLLPSMMSTSTASSATAS